jgi:palmitoyl transferase
MRKFANVKFNWTTALVASFLVISLPCRADDAVAMADQAPTGTPRPGPDAATSTRWDVYLSGYAYHGRGTYTEAQRRKLNETTWGGGLGRTFRNERGNDESWYLTGIRDSNKRPQWMAGYSYQWLLPLKSQDGPALGGGFTALLIRRHGWHDGRPFPAVLPVVSIGNRTAQLVATYVPHLSGQKEKGNILMLVLKLSM